MIPAYLDCSPAYRNMPDDERDANCGCGTAKSKIVPDTIYGLSIKAACCIHDFDYSEGKTEQDKENADYRFMVNMLAIIEHESVWFLKYPRRLRAATYYSAVASFGHGPFWAGKTNPDDPTVHIA